MWLYYLLLAISATAQADFSTETRRHQSRFQRGASPQAFMNQNATKRQNIVKNQKIIIAGTGTMDANGKTSLKINVKIAGRLPQPTGEPERGIGARGVFNEEEQSGLVAHNNFRQIHQAPAMTLDRKMCDAAKAYAQRLANMGTLMHSPSSERPGQGENLSMGCSTNAAQTMEQAVTNWYNEVCNPGYDFSAGGFSGGTGHFTQVVWKGSTVLGVGRAESTRGRMKCAYIVGRYKPAGNMMGSFPENVKKGSFNRNYCNSIANMKRYFGINGETVDTGTPITQVDAPEIPSKKASEGIVLLKKKKSFVGFKHH